MPTAKLTATQTHYEIHGQGTPILLIHGLAVDSMAWLSLIPHLKGPYQFIRYDLRGSGQTVFDGEPFDLDDLANDALELLDHLQIKAAHVIGHSMGGMIARHFAAKFPERVLKLVLTHSRIRKNWLVTRFWESLLSLREKYNLSSEEVLNLVMPWGYSSAFLADDSKVKTLRQVVRNNRYPQSMQHFKLQANAVADFDAAVYSSRLSMPVLLTAGSKDLLAPSDDIRTNAKTLANAVFVEQEGGAHAPAVEAPEWLAKIILDFLE